jgi:hypothetical protein
MGVASEAIAEIFGYRLKKIDRPIPYISSRDICQLYLHFQLFSPSPALSSFVFVFFVRIFFLDTLILLYYLHFKYPEVYFGTCFPRGPLVRAYK